MILDSQGSRVSLIANKAEQHEEVEIEKDRVCMHFLQQEHRYPRLFHGTGGFPSPSPPSFCGFTLRSKISSTIPISKAS